MTDSAIQVEHISKRYQLGELQHDTLRDVLAESLARPFRRIPQLLSGKKELSSNSQNNAHTLWALNDVSLTAHVGEAIGIIGRNGAGKSTLLKIISRITEPSSGRIVINGRVGSLLEVGTGFHPELTGRENIFLNGAILGMNRWEIRRKFDEIVDFAEIEKFLDTPVKHYSSGMYVRLAFAVAAHLEPEILLVDEVLAVGDFAFQKKCLGKMSDVSRSGRTILFVSHNMVAVQSLCNTAYWLDSGQIKDAGPAQKVVSGYLMSSFCNLNQQTWADPSTAPGNEKVRIRHVAIFPEGQPGEESIRMETPLQIEVEFWCLAPSEQLHLTLHVADEQNTIAFTTSSNQCDAPDDRRAFAPGLYRSTCYLPGNFLNSGVHHIHLLVVEDFSNVLLKQEDVLSFQVLDLTPRPGAWFGKEPGGVRPILRWTNELLADSTHTQLMTDSR